MDRNEALRGQTLPLKRVVLFTAFLLLMAVAVDLSAGVLVAPTSVIMSETRRTGRITIQNPTDKPKEVTIGFSYGLPESDSLGNVRIILQDSAVTDTKSCMDWIKAFPKKMILQPNSRQVVRLVAKPPKDLDDGEYWCRIIVKSQEGQTSIPLPNSEDKITTKLNMVMQTALVCKYRTGNLLSKLDVTKTDISRDDSTVNVMIDMVNKGNVSYIGLLNVKLVDASNREVAKHQIDLAVYRELTRRISLPFTGKQYKEPLRVEVNISNEGRSDIPPEDMIIGNSIEYTSLVR